MPNRKPTFLDLPQQQQMALSRWDNEGGAGPCGPLGSSISDEVEFSPKLSNSDLVKLRVRVIALENLVITLLAEASDRQLNLAHGMADYISPRPGFTHHPLTIRAASQMIDLVERASRFRSVFDLSPIVEGGNPAQSFPNALANVKVGGGNGQ